MLRQIEMENAYLVYISANPGRDSPGRPTHPNAWTNTVGREGKGLMNVSVNCFKPV